MSIIFGWDFGTASVSASVILEDEITNHVEIKKLVVRVVPYSDDDKSVTQMREGQAITKNQKRTTARTSRKTNDRYKKRRFNLVDFLKKEFNTEIKENLYGLDALQIYNLRARAAREKVTLEEFGRIMFILNQKRGYNGGSSEVEDKKEKEYVQNILNRHDEIRAEGFTIGEYFYDKLKGDRNYRVKENIFPREAYKEEFETIWNEQKKHYPRQFSDNNKHLLRDRIIFYQRPLKSQKGLVSRCRFQKITAKNKEGKEITAGPRVSPKSSPLFRVCDIWESINKIKITDKSGSEYIITHEQKNKIFDYWDNNEHLSKSNLFSILELNSKKFIANDYNKGGAKGNTTKIVLREALKEMHGFEHLLAFNLCIEEVENKKIVSRSVEQEPLYALWHVIYSISDKDICRNTLVSKFNISADVADKLAGIDFKKQGFGNKSFKTMRQILPYLKEGYGFDKACLLAGYRHSDYLTAEENMERILKNKVESIPTGSLRQPVVEKILNVGINILNELLEEFGNPDEQRIELARDLTRSKKEREHIFKTNRSRENDNKSIDKKIEAYGLKPTRKSREAYRLYHETGGICLYCMEKMDLKGVLSGQEYDEDHILTKSFYADNSSGAKTATHQACNKKKGQRTAFDYMSSQPFALFEKYTNFIEYLNKNKNPYDKKVFCDFEKISDSKLALLLTPEEKIPTDFVERQLRETQYITSEAKELFGQVCKKITVTSGTVTAMLRNLWGLNGILENKDNEQVVDKRMDHRHHAVDSLVVACTKPPFIDKINNLNSQVVRKTMADETKGFRAPSKMALLDKYLCSQNPLDLEDVKNHLSNIIVSFKPGKRVISHGRNITKNKEGIKVSQEKTNIPRGKLHQEQVYGKISHLHKDKKGKVVLEARYVIRYKLSKEGLFNQCGTQEEIDKEINCIVDNGIRQIVKAHFIKHDYNVTAAFQEPILFNNTPIKAVRCFAALKNAYPIIAEDTRNNTSFTKFVILGNNHNLSIYEDTKGKIKILTIPFIEAVKRKNIGLPIIIKTNEDLGKFDSYQDKALLPKPETKEDVAKFNSYPDKSLLPEPDWSFKFSFERNEMVVFDMKKEEVLKHIKEHNLNVISKNTYRVQKIDNYVHFRHHLATTIGNVSEYKKPKLPELKNFTGCKIKVNVLGEITHVDEVPVKI